MQYDTEKYKITNKLHSKMWSVMSCNAQLEDLTTQ